MTLPQETIDKIKANAAKATNKQDEKSREGSKDYGRRISFLDGFEEGHNAGATEWAGKAQGLADFIQRSLVQHEVDKAALLKEWPQLNGKIEDIVLPWINEAKALLDKYKEVTNG